MCDELSCLSHSTPFHKMRVCAALCVDVILQQLRDTNAWLKSIKGAYIYSRSISAHNLWRYSPYSLSIQFFILIYARLGCFW